MTLNPIIQKNILFTAFFLPLLFVIALFTSCDSDESNSPDSDTLNDSEGVFPLPSGYFIPAKMPMHVVYPRPDSETQTHARHRWMHSKMTYEIPIGVQGGAWPFKYEIITAPDGASIGQLYGSQDYGVLKIQTIASGSHNIVIRVTDQEMNTVDISWTATVDDSKFTFIQEGYTGTKVGTIDQPLGTWNDWYKNDADDTSYANQILVFRGGNYTLTGDASQNGNVEINSGTKTPSIIAYPDEIPIIDCNTAKIFTRNGTSANDIFISGIQWENARTDLANSHFFWATSETNRITFWNNTFDTIEPGTAGNDNPSCVFIPATANKQYVLYKHNTHKNINTGGANGSYIDIYKASYVLVEENTATDSDNGYGLWMKGTIAYVSVRANDINSGGGITVGYGIEAGTTPPHDHEICWNRVIQNSTNRNTLLFAGSNFYIGKTFNSFIYRNTFVNNATWVRFRGNEDFEVYGNVVVMNANSLSKWDTSIMDENIEGNLTATTDSNEITDSEGLLIDASKTEYLGKRGFEVFDPR
ncbi:hypothetical protein [Flavivirga jejuensis]|uniref:Parallel beta helix pectate lyase-like protein n=1 Tax=Flavivirga jejuensis TaxID=870487 RepID=A0ABT8WLJ6_9FLAO|nr:hypothetical protein [Flavivirga jejuensis]MDO5974030.1 hypothetical protein [Flavivirga jejuensis]